MSGRPVAVVGMSGGVDSCVTAYLAREAGFRVVGAMLQIKSPGASRDADEAAFSAAAEKLGIEAKVVPAPEFREKVILPAAAQYGAGRTPNPCCIGNAEGKLTKLFEVADARGASGVGTGHYAALKN
ncbi:MAG: hypothetical protein MJ016_02515, partial [Victivallaceae bacterium]|nr:hypothetical protein [Victivallaceae bacterium]